MLDVKVVVEDVVIDVTTSRGAWSEKDGGPVQIRASSVGTRLSAMRFEGVLAAITRGVVGGLRGRLDTGDDSGALGGVFGSAFGSTVVENFGSSDGLARRFASGFGPNVADVGTGKVGEGAGVEAVRGSVKASDEEGLGVSHCERTTTCDTGSRSSFRAFKGVSKEQVSSTEKGFGGVSEELAGDGHVVKRGVNYERNRLNRLRKKAVKETRVSAVSTSERVGFFSGCDAAVQSELRDTRAQLLVLQNRRKIIEEEKKIQGMSSTVGYVQDTMRLVRQAAEAAKLAKDSRVAGWAHTVLTNESEERAEAAPVTTGGVSDVASESHNDISSKCGVLLDCDEDCLGGVVRPRSYSQESLTPSEENYVLNVDGIIDERLSRVMGRPVAPRFIPGAYKNEKKQMEHETNQEFFRRVNNVRRQSFDDDDVLDLNMLI